MGAGRTAIVEAIFGLRKVDSGSVYIRGQKVEISNPDEAIKQGISLVPESRKEQGLVLGMNCVDNMTLPKIKELTSGPFISNSKEQFIFDRYKSQLQIKTPSSRQIVGNLSGGNQQKIVIAKWLAMHPKVLIVDEPTRGIDVGSKAEIHQLIRDLAEEGYAIIVISSEMPEIMRVSDRIFAMYNGKITRELSSSEVTEDNLVQAISGI